MKQAFYFLGVALVFILLTAATQIGGVTYLLYLAFRKNSRTRIQRFGVFFSFYLIGTFIMTPLLAPLFGREKIKNTD